MDRTPSKADMSYKLHHIAVCHRDPQMAEKLFCELLGHGKAQQENFCGVPVRMLCQRHNDLQLALLQELPSQPWLPSRYGIQYIALECPNLSLALNQLQAQGITLLALPQASHTFDYAVVESIEGLPVVVLQSKAAAASHPVQYSHDNPHGFILNHTAVLSEQLAASEGFWRDNFGLQRIYFNDCEGSGFMGLVDSHWQPGKHMALLEILNPPHVLNADQYGYDLAGVSYFHLSYRCNSVGKAWQHLVDHGLHPSLPPHEEAGSGAQDAFAFGPDLLAFELSGGPAVEQMMQLDDIHQVNEVFSVTANEMLKASGPLTRVPDNYLFKI